MSNYSLGCIDLTHDLQNGRPTPIGEPKGCGPTPWVIYGETDRPACSKGELLSYILWYHLCLQDGWSPADFVALAKPQTASGLKLSASIKSAIKLFETPLQSGGFIAFARAIGGGPVTIIPPEHWEIDNALPRYALSAYAYEQPFETNAKPTHWIFLDKSVEAQIYELHVDNHLPVSRNETADLRTTTIIDGLTPPAVSTDVETLAEYRFIRLPEVELLVGLKKSEIFRRMGEDRFPSSEPIGGGRAKGWRASAIRAWLKNPT